MKILPLLVAATLLACGTQESSPPAADAPPAPDPAADVAGVRAVAAGFRAALVEGDSATALGYLHPELVVYEGGRRESLGEYRSGHLAGDMAYLAAVPPVLQDDTVVVAGDMALYLGESTSRGTFRGREIDRGTAETLVMVRTPAGWRIRHVHWSSGG